MEKTKSQVTAKYGIQSTVYGIAPWEQTTLPTILCKYDLNHVYNADEFGLFYCVQPNKFLHLINEHCVGGKHSKLRLPGLTAANAVV